jgi:hypothetical protein
MPRRADRWQVAFLPCHRPLIEGQVLLVRVAGAACGEQVAGTVGSTAAQCEYVIGVRLSSHWPIAVRAAPVELEERMTSHDVASITVVPHTPAGGCVARPVRWSEVGGAVVGVVEVPRVTGVDGLPASGAGDATLSGDLRGPCSACAVVLVGVTALLPRAARPFVLGLVRGAVGVASVDDRRASGS